MTTEGVLWGAGIGIPHPRSLVARASREKAAASGTELRGQDGLAMSRHSVRHASDGMDLEHGLGLGAERDSRLKGVLNSMVAKELE